MRRFLYFVIAACASMLISCSKEGSENNKLTINNGAEFLSLDYMPREGQLNVWSPERYNVTSGASWLTISKNSVNVGADVITISLEENDGPARFTTIDFRQGESKQSFVVSQSAKGVGFDDATHYIYVTLGTMPTLYAGMYMLRNEKPSQFFFSRTKTFLPAMFPPYTTNVPYLDEELGRVRDYMMATIRSINREDPTAVFGFMVDDLRSRLAYEWFVAQGIDSSRVKTTLLSDGTATYEEFYNRFGSDPTAQSNWNQFKSDVEALDWNHEGRYSVSRSNINFDSFGQAFYMVTRPNYRLIMQHSNLLETASPFIKQQLEYMDIRDITPYEVLDALSADKQQQFYNMANFDHNRFLDMFDASPKPNLIILGTTGSDHAQKLFTERIYNEYKATHDIFFKPHPADLSSASYDSDFPGLKLLPGQMPFEIFVWSLLDEIDIIGGFASTVYLTLPVDKVRFIFAPNARSLFRPLNLLFADAPDVEWVQ